MTNSTDVSDMKMIRFGNRVDFISGVVREGQRGRNAPGSTSLKGGIFGLKNNKLF